MLKFTYLKNVRGVFEILVGWFENQQVFRRWLMYESCEVFSYSLSYSEIIINNSAPSCAFKIVEEGIEAIVEVLDGNGRQSYKRVQIEVEMLIPYEESADRYYYHNLEGGILRSRSVEAINYKAFKDILKRKNGIVAYETEEDEKTNILTEVRR